MDSFAANETSFLDLAKSNKRKSRFSDVVTAIMPSTRQKGIQTIVFQTLAILLSVSILYLLAQVYFIFRPCLKALLWALLCGSALYPFKVSLDTALSRWLDDLEHRNRSFCAGLLFLPLQCIYEAYRILNRFISQNKIIFLLFHFRHQILHASSIFGSIMLTIASHNKGIITAFVILCSSAQVLLFAFRYNGRILHVFTSFNFLPSIFGLLFFYALHCVGLIGHVLFTVFAAISAIGLCAIVYDFLRNPKFESKIAREIDALIRVISEKLREKLRKCYHLAVGRFRLAGDDDSPDSGAIKLGHHYIIWALFTVFFFELAEQMQLSNVILAILIVDIVTTKVLSKILQYVPLSAIAQRWSERSGAAISARLEQDIFFKVWISLFLKGDQLIKKTIQASSDLLTSLGLISTVTIIVAFFSVFLSVKIYGECYSVINLLRNELIKIDFIRDSINATLTDVTNMDYLNNLLKENLLSSHKLNLDEADQVLLNKMLIEFGENILIFLNLSANGSSGAQIAPAEIIDSNLTSLTSANEQSSATLVDAGQISLKSLFNQFPLEDLKNFKFEIMFDFINSHAKTYLPLFKGFLSVLYTFVFVILDSGSVLLSFVLNSVIFALALFYLLSTSRNKYKPIELLDDVVGSLFTTNCEQSRFSRYVVEVVNSIFAATIKISLFYGVYTWLLHSLFDMQLCCIPAVIAAILAAVPILTAYWASIPACIYLYYFDTTLPLVKSLTMFAMAIAPSFIVDASIYSDIKRAGHPYLTGLAITCGVVYYGVEGALFGPLWLCFLFIIIHMCTSLTENNINNSLASTPT